MNEFTSTRFTNKLASLLGMIMFVFVGVSTLSAQSECACKGTLQVSVDDACEAEITAEMLLANGTTCGGTASATVTLMKSPTGDVISQGVGSADLLNGHLYIGKTVYAKVTSAPLTTGAPTNSCWTTLHIEDKLAPVIICPDDVTLTCYEMASFCPEVIENCSHYTMDVIAETVTVNDCKASTGLPDDVLKVVTRTYQAIDESGNKSLPCTFTITVVGLPSLDEPYVNMPINRWIAGDNALVCDGDYAELPNGHPSPTPIAGKPGTGVPHLLMWNPTTAGVGTIEGNSPSAITLAGGTSGAGGGRTLGAQICFSNSVDQTITFDWAASMRNNAGSTSGGQFLNDEPVYSINGVDTNLPAVVTGSNSASGTLSVPLVKGDQFCLKVYTMNIAFYTVLNISNIRSDVATAVPVLYLPLYPDPDLYCNILTSYTDVKLPAIGCVTKIMRTWQVLEWSCRDVQRMRTHLQMIEIVDNVGPVVTCPADYTVSTNGHACEAGVAFPAVDPDDNCSTNTTVDITYPGGHIKGSNGGYGILPVGCHTVTYTVYDECYNSTVCTVRVTVEDNTPPVAICDEFTTIGLTLDGKAWVPATSFDDGSYDECELSKMLVRRMNPQACTPCKTPEFPGFTYLGEYVNVGKNAPHYYYISKHRATPDVAIKTAQAMGGYVTAINTADENAWVYGKVQEWHLGEDYLIGLRDVKKKGLFAWLSGETSTYRNWAASSPQDVLDGTNSYDYVRVLDKDATWFDFGSVKCDEQEWLYVVEITDPCGFSSFAQFCCSDIGANQMVQFRVIDKSGNYNDCMVSAVVQDKLPPAIICPPHMTVTCNDYFDLDQLTHKFGWPTTYDNCDPITVTTDSIIELNSCRIGKITRHFTATDEGGRTASCTQIIIVEGVDNGFEMTANRWPKDEYVEGCANPDDARFHPDRTGYPDLTADNICSLVGYDYDDHLFTFNNGVGEACFKIIRHWKVIDWCQQIQTSTGYEYASWEYNQTIVVYDTVNPEITSNCNRKSVCTYDPTCTSGYIELTASADDNCTEILRYTYKIDLNNDGSFDSGLTKTGTANTADASGTYPIGNHRIQWAFEDRCGNVTKCDQLFDVNNCKAPTPYCINGLSSSLMPMDMDNDGDLEGMLEIWAKDFDNGSIHPCGYPIIFSFSPVTINPTSGMPVVQASQMYTCEDVGVNEVRVYSAVVIRMGSKDTIIQDYCTTFIDIQDNADVCDDDDNGRIVLSGTTKTELQKPVSDVKVKLEGSEMEFMTDGEGEFSFSDMPKGGSYVVMPFKNDDHLNGVSTIDLVMIQRHILGIEKITSPYKLIAADINKDKKVTAADLAELRRLILGTIDELPNNTSWRFVDRDYDFQDPQNAYAEIFPEVTFVNDLQNNLVTDFVSIKTGDVNEDVITNVNDRNTSSRSNNSLVVITENQEFDAADQIVIPMAVEQAIEAAGYQFTLHFDNELFDLVTIDPVLTQMNDQNFGFARLAEGIITVSYNEDDNLILNTGDVLFNLVLKAKDQGRISEGLWIDSSFTPAEAYDAEYQKWGVELRISGDNIDDIVLYQNNPNPFKANTIIGFDLPQDMSATVSVYDVTGKVVKSITQDFVKGYNTVEINKSELGASGVLYYTLEAGLYRATKKMVVIE